MKSQLEILPTEVLNRICYSFTESQALYSLCLTSRACYASACHALYREPSLVCADLVFFTRSILQTRSLVSSVKALHISVSQSQTFCYGLIMRLLLAHLHNTVQLFVTWQDQSTVNSLEGVWEIEFARRLLSKLEDFSPDSVESITPCGSGVLRTTSMLLDRYFPLNLRAEGMILFRHHPGSQGYFNSVVSVDLTNCQYLSALDLDLVIRSCPKVKRFSFSIQPDAASSVRSILEELTSDDVVQSLEQVSHCLQYFSLRVSGREAVRSLQKLVALEHLHISALDLIEYVGYGDSEECAPFVGKLPAGLKVLRIFGLDILSVSMSRALTLLSKSRRILPNLESVILSDDREKFYESKREDFEASGIAYTVQK